MPSKTFSPSQHLPQVLKEFLTQKDLDAAFGDYCQNATGLVAP
ncbi:MAG: hypothetical protein NT154_48470 [Verrucomicrobia bacterium]|nr:hypothetical protein [Verrucomicrobiota bacterium]